MPPLTMDPLCMLCNVNIPTACYFPMTSEACTVTRALTSEDLRLSGEGHQGSVLRPPGAAVTLLRGWCDGGGGGGARLLPPYVVCRRQHLPPPLAMIRLPRLFKLNSAARLVAAAETNSRRLFLTARRGADFRTRAASVGEGGFSTASAGWVACSLPKRRVSELTNINWFCLFSKRFGVNTCLFKGHALSRWISAGALEVDFFGPTSILLSSTYS